MEHAGAGTAAVDDFVDPEVEVASSFSAPQRPWAAPVVQTLRLTSGPSAQHDEPRSTSPAS